MKVLFVINSTNNKFGAINAFEKSLAYCKANADHVFIAEVVREGQPSSINVHEASYRLFVKESAAAVIQVHHLYNSIISAIGDQGFVPDVVEFFDEYDLSYLCLQQKLLDIHLPKTTKVIFNITQEKLPAVYTDENRTTLPGFFHSNLLRFILQASDAVYCSYDSVYKELVKVTANNSVVLSDELSNDEAIEEKYNRIHNGVKKNSYPFHDAKEFPLKPGTIPLLSVVIPYYNMGAYIEETVDSVLNSSHDNIEILIVNDGSTEQESLNKLESIQTKSKKIRVIHQKNAGVAAARNNGIISSKGEVVALLDADDIVDATYYEKAINILMAFHNVSFVGCWTELFDETGTLDKWITYNPELPLFFLLNSFNTQAVVVKKEALLTYGMQDSSLQMVLDDWESVLSMVANEVRGIVIPEFLFRYRIRRNSVYRSHQNRWTRSYEKIINKHFDKVSKYAKDILLLLNTNGPNIFYKDPLHSTDYYRMLNEVPNFRIRNGVLNKWINRYYNFVELNPVGIKIRSAVSSMKNKIQFWNL
ncbi:glycosyltransferase family 2 protein [Chryseosolibacter indicus]|uniref:Glycosyltransferase family 2 protein n=1 Tax=Chryseosolibacter indicus TaxID=2782351 RepID=A0ABS5VRY3_9BACT|nr:glycosyltransferase family A protein [Chryseosolibacter indicus]MBT1703595.1 glycosyltransferase family 2 protein [Chryseosolibacter indicus]